MGRIVLVVKDIEDLKVIDVTRNVQRGQTEITFEGIDLPEWMPGLEPLRVGERSPLWWEYIKTAGSLQLHTLGYDEMEQQVNEYARLLLLDLREKIETRSNSHGPEGYNDFSSPVRRR